MSIINSKSAIDFKTRLLSFYPSLEIARSTLLPRIEKYKKVRVVADTFYINCWQWTGSLDTKGYGIITIRKDPDKWIAQVHKLIYVLYNNEYPNPSLCILHTCDYPSCFNPDHLFLGTLGQNAFDASKKGRIANQFSYETRYY